MWGQQLWSTCLTDVIILTTIVRQTDPTWTATLERFRINCPTLQDIATVNDRLISPTTSTLLPPAGTVTAVSANKTRHEAIQYIEQLFLSKLPDIDATDELNWRQRETLLIKANVTDPRYNTPVDPRHADYVRKLPEKRLTYVGNLFCIIGAKYMITANIDVANGIANGTIAILRNIILKDGVDVSVTNLGQGQAAHSVLASDVECLIFQHAFPQCNTTSAYPTLPPGHFPLKPTNKNLQIPFNDNGAKIKIQINQLPITNATVLTGHKTQGMTLDNIVLGSMGDKHRYGSTGWLYVVLSRVRDISGLYTLAPLSTDLSKYKKRHDVLEEMDRLRAIENITLHRVLPLTNKAPAC